MRERTVVFFREKEAKSVAFHVLWRFPITSRQFLIFECPPDISALALLEDAVNDLLYSWEQAGREIQKTLTTALGGFNKPLNANVNLLQLPAKH